MIALVILLSLHTQKEKLCGHDFFLALSQLIIDEENGCQEDISLILAANLPKV